MIQTHAEDLLRHIASRCVGAPWVVLSRAGGGCSPREPVCVSLPWVHAKEVTQNSPHHRLSRSCISKRAKIFVERWQIPSFVPARDPEACPSHGPLVDCDVLRSTRPRAVTTRPQTRGEVAVLGRLDMFLTTRELPSSCAGAPPSGPHRSCPAPCFSPRMPGGRDTQVMRCPSVLLSTPVMRHVVQRRHFPGSFTWLALPVSQKRRQQRQRSPRPVGPRQPGDVGICP